MDLETENRIAAILMREAAELRRQSEKEGVLAYLQKPNVRTRPNSRFLTATVRGVQQAWVHLQSAGGGLWLTIGWLVRTCLCLTANRAVEVNEMWRIRQKELELDKRGRGTSMDKSSGDRSHMDDNSSRSTGRHAVVDKSTGASASCSSKREYEHSPEGLKDEELEEFLHSRTKRGRGAVGPRMDETGPYLPPRTDEEPNLSPDVRKRRVIHGPERPPSLKSYESSEEEELHEERRKKNKKSHSRDKEHSKKRKSNEKSRHKKKKREEKRSKKHHR